MTAPRVRPVECDPIFVAANIRGVMFAAFARRDVIQQMLGIGNMDDVDAFQAAARSDLEMAKTAIAQAKHRMTPAL